MSKHLTQPHVREVLAWNVQGLRLELGISQEKLGELAGFHRTYVSQVERRVTNITADNLQRLADVLSVPVARLFQLPPSDLRKS